MFPGYFVSTVSSLYQAGIQGDYVHQVAKAEGLADELESNLQTGAAQVWINEQFDRVISRLPVDVYCSCEIRCARVVEPVIIGKPVTGCC